MEQIIVQGGYRLQGKVKIDGAKNAVLPMLAATILAEGTSTISNVPVLSDVLAMNDILRQLNLDVEFNEELNEITIDAQKKIGVEAKHELVSQLRASFLVMGPLLARNGHAVVAKPGGCTIGARPIDLHLKGFEALGARIVQNDGFIEAFADNLIGNNVYLDHPSVGATQNIMMAAATAKGSTTIQNAAQDPEVVQLAGVLNKMGAKIFCAGTDTIQITGVKNLSGMHACVEQDRLEAGTFMIAAAMTEGNVLIEKANVKQNRELITKLVKMGATVIQEADGVRVKGAKILNPVDITTAPHPGFPTDLQAPLSAMMMFAKGSTITETIFENRFQHFKGFRQMNADIRVEGNVAIMAGSVLGGEIVGADVEACDLRAAAAFVLAGLKAKGITRVSNLEYLDRGYYKFHEKLQMLGGSIVRVSLQGLEKKSHG